MSAGHWLCPGLSGWSCRMSPFHVMMVGIYSTCHLPVFVPVCAGLGILMTRPDLRKFLTGCLEVRTCHSALRSGPSVGSLGMLAGWDCKVLSRGGSRPQLSQAPSGSTCATQAGRLALSVQSLPFSSQQSESAKLREEALTGKISKVHGLEPMAVTSLSTEWRVLATGKPLSAQIQPFVKSSTPPALTQGKEFLQSFKLLFCISSEGA